MALNINGWYVDLNHRPYSDLCDARSSHVPSHIFMMYDVCITLYAKDCCPCNCCDGVWALWYFGRDGSCCGVGWLSCAVWTQQSRRHPFWLYHTKRYWPWWQLLRHWLIVMCSFNSSITTPSILVVSHETQRITPHNHRSFPFGNLDDDDYYYFVLIAAGVHWWEVEVMIWRRWVVGKVAQVANVVNVEMAAARKDSHAGHDDSYGK